MKLKVHEALVGGLVVESVAVTVISFVPNWRLESIWVCCEAGMLLARLTSRPVIGGFLTVYVKIALAPLLRKPPSAGEVKVIWDCDDVSTSGHVIVGITKK